MSRPYRPPPYPVKPHRTGHARITDRTGHAIYLGEFGSADSKEKYREACANLALHNGVWPRTRGGITVAELCRRYREWAPTYYRKRGVASSTVRTMKSPLESLEATFGSSPADRFDQLNLIALRGTWEATMTVRTVNRYTRIVRSAFRWGVQRGLVPQSTWVALTAVEALKVGRCRARPDGKVGPVSDEDVERTLVKLDRTYPTVAAMVRLQRLTGMRPSEVCSLRPMDLDRSGPIWSYIVPPEVNKEAHRHRPRPVQIGPRAQVVLLPFLGGPADQPAFRPHPYRIKRRQAWPGFPTDTYRKAIRRATERAGVSPWSPNQLRHAAATQVRKEKGLDAARAYLGHSESSTTEIYAVRDVEIARKVAEEMG